MVISFPSHSGVLQAINQPHGSALTVGMGWERLVLVLVLVVVLVVVLVLVLVLLLDSLYSVGGC